MDHEIFVAFEGGGSDECVIGIYANREAAETVATGRRSFVVRYVHCDDCDEYLPQE
jgi:hypothetical protein